jgi:hypothetical protein
MIDILCLGCGLKTFYDDINFPFPFVAPVRSATLRESDHRFLRSAPVRRPIQPWETRI